MCLELRPHPLSGRFPPNLKIAFRVLSAKVRKPKERERFEPCLVFPFPVSPGFAAKRYQPRLVRMNFQPELRQPLLKLLQDPLGICPVLEARHEIVGIPDNYHVASDHFLAPDLCP